MNMHTNLKIGKLAVATLLIGSTLSFSATAPKYTITDLGAFNNYSHGVLVNNRGQVAGNSYTRFIKPGEIFPTSPVHAFVIDDENNMIDLGTLGGKNSEAEAMNNNGQVVGYADMRSGYHAFITDSENNMIDLGTLGGRYSRAYAINNSGQVAGNSHTEDGNAHAFVTDSEGKMIDLGTLGRERSSAEAINNRGQVAGNSYDIDNNMYAFVTDIEGNMIDLGTLGGKNSKAVGINGRGQVIGFASAKDGNYHAFITDSENNMIDLGVLGARSSYASAINDNGQVVGYVYYSSGYMRHKAFVADNKGNMFDLSKLVDNLSNNWKTLTYAKDISNSGYITGVGITVDGYYHAYLLTPIVPIITIEPTITNITDISAIVTWETDIPSTSIVNFGTTESVESNKTYKDLVTNHSVALTGLTYETLYYVSVKSEDENGNSSEVSEVITFTTLADTTPPVFSISPENKTVEATALLTNVDLGEVYATDNGNGEVALSNDAPSDGFGLGTTTVTWTATDEAGNTATATQVITVKDTTAPVLDAPDDITIRSNRTLNIVDFGTATATDIFEPVTIVNDAPVEGFPRKSITTVTWTATDVNGNTATAMQLVTLTNKKEKK